jgi:glucan phosphoethanolaminetransferase (alkaline phosphatase superfamily)
MADLIALMLAFACTATPAAAIDDARPNILLIVIDTLRADRLGVYGDRRGLTPFLDGLAKTGVVFANAYAASSWTTPGASVPPGRHTVRRNTFDPWVD